MQHQYRTYYYYQMENHFRDPGNMLVGWRLQLHPRSSLWASEGLAQVGGGGIIFNYFFTMVVGELWKIAYSTSFYYRFVVNELVIYKFTKIYLQAELRWGEDVNIQVSVNHISSRHSRVLVKFLLNPPFHTSREIQYDQGEFFTSYIHYFVGYN